MTEPIAQTLVAAARWTGASLLLVVAAARIARVLAPRPRLPSACRIPPLETFVIAALLAAGSVAFTGFCGILASWPLVGIAIGLFVVTLPLRSGRGPAFPPRRLRLRERAVPLALVAAPLLVDLPLYLATPPTNWDAMTYHLFLPARWIQEGRILHVPTVFSDNAAAYAPHNGALLFGWSMSLLQSDVVCNVVQLAALGALALALYRLALTLGVRPAVAALSGITVFWIQPLRLQAASANVDAFMLGFFGAALLWLVRYLRRPAWRTLLLCGFAAGLAAGTKTVGLPLAVFAGLPAVVLASLRRRPVDLAAFVGGAAVGGGWWYLRNLTLYGNPLFPLDWGLGPLRFRGAYGVDAIRAGEFHVADPGGLLAFVLERWGPLLCGLLVGGIAALLYEALSLRRRGRPRQAGAAALLALLGSGWALWYVFVVPHSEQTRFLLPSLLIALVGYACLLARLTRLGRGAGLAAALVVCGALAVTGRFDADWLPRLHALRDAGESLAPVAAALIAALAACLGGAYERRFALRQTLFAFALIAAVQAVALAAVSADGCRATLYSRAGFRTWAEGFVPFQNPRLRPQRIAYSGANVPFTLVGPGFRHTVVYGNTRGEAGDGFYEHWRRDPRTYAYHKPGLYRGPEDEYEGWLENLRRQRVDLLVLFSLHDAERAYLAATESGFPLEQRWVAEHPERFEPLRRGRFAEIYRLRP